MKNRNAAKVIIFSFLTAGIYGLFWTKWTRDEMVVRGAHIPRFVLLFIPIFALICLGLMQFAFRYFLSSSEVGDVGSSARTLFNIIAVVLGVAAVFALIAIPVYWFFRYCQAAAFVTHNQTPLGLSFGLWLVFAILGVWFVWPGIMQDGFNKIGATADLPPQPPAAEDSGNTASLSGSTSTPPQSPARDQN